MNLKVYKWTTHYCNQNTIYYAVRDLDLADNKPCITISLHGDSWALYSQMFPKIDLGPPSEGDYPHPEESSFMDLLLVTGILQSQIEYIFTNLDLDTHAISIQPRHTYGPPSTFTKSSIVGFGNVQSWGGKPANTGTNPNTITLGSSFGHAKPINI